MSNTSRPISSLKANASSVSARGPIPASDNASGVLAFIASLWCGLSFTAAALLTPTMISEREWSGLLVMLVFVGIGVGLLVLAVMSRLGRLLHGCVVLDLDDVARVGAPLAGTISFERGVREGVPFLVKLECQRVRWVSLANRTTHGSGKTVKLNTLWSAEGDSVAMAGAKLRVAFTLPPDLPGSAGAAGDNSKIVWSVSVTQQSAFRASNSFTVAVDGPPPDADAIAHLLREDFDPPNLTTNPLVVYGGTGVAIAIFVGALLFMMYQHASALFQFVVELFR